MPGELADAVDVGSHQSHDLRFARELVFIFLLFIPRVFGSMSRLRSLGIVGRSSGRSPRGRCNIFPDEGLGKEDRVELDTKANLQGSSRQRPELTSD